MSQPSYSFLLQVVHLVIFGLSKYTTKFPPVFHLTILTNYAANSNTALSRVHSLLDTSPNSYHYET